MSRSGVLATANVNDKVGVQVLLSSRVGGLREQVVGRDGHVSYELED